jgi:hypothetical protein
MSEDKKPFTVSDRRHFTSEGEVRKSDEGTPAPAPAAEAGAAPPSPPAATAASAAAPAPAATEADHDTAAPGPYEQAGSGRYPSDLLGLLISLGAQASMLLMGGPEGQSPDLEGAHGLIELLGDLKNKTEGRRTTQEDQLLEGLLYELRMAYVQATKVGAR